MRLVYQAPEIELFEHSLNDSDKDLIGLKQKGEDLSRLVDEIEDPMVIAVDGAWGSGKSHFLKLWAGSHQKAHEQDTTVVYFDAFENDYFDEPLIGLTKAIIDRLPPTSTTRKFIQNTKKMASRLTMPALRVGGAIATAGATEITGAIADAAIRSGWRETEKASEQFWSQFTAKQSAMFQFRKALDELTGSDGTERRRLVIIIDELDRCRPDYALSLLEIAKHFFSTDNVHFVLGVNLSELRNSVKARYGASINAEKYLQKFLSIVFPFHSDLPHRRQQAGFVKHFETVCRQLGTFGSIVRHEFPTDLLKRLSPHLKVSLRDVEKIASILVILPESRCRQDVHRNLLIGLIILNVIRPDIIELAREGKLQYSQILELFDLRDVGQNTEMSSFKCTWLGALTPILANAASDQERGEINILFQRMDRNTVLKEQIILGLDAIQLPPS